MLDSIGVTHERIMGLGFYGAIVSFLFYFVYYLKNSILSWPDNLKQSFMSSLKGPWFIGFAVYFFLYLIAFFIFFRLLSSGESG
jgi:hypothetical protein